MTIDHLTNLSKESPNQAEFLNFLFGDSFNSIPIDNYEFCLFKYDV